MESQKPYRHRWSARLRHPNTCLKGDQLSIHEDCSVWMQATTNLRMTTGRWEWAIRIINTGRSVFVGVCLQSCAKSNNCSYGYFAYAGHGNFIVNQNGAIFRNNRLEEKCKTDQRAFQFGNGDTLQMCYDSSELTFRVENKRSGQIVFIPTDELKQGDCYVPCAQPLEKGTILSLL